MRAFSKILILLCINMMFCGKRENHRVDSSAHNHQEQKHGDPVDTSSRSEHTMQKGHDMSNMQEAQREEEVLRLNKADVLKANIRTAIAEIKNIDERSRFLGTVSMDERASKVISARVPGRIEQLFVKSPSVFIRKGQAIYSIYSEELYSDISDYKIAQIYRDAKTAGGIGKKIASSARQRLKLSGLNDGQIESLAKSEKIPGTIVFYSPASGYISDLMIRQGQYVEAGSPLYKVFSLTSVWVETQIYAEDLSQISSKSSFDVEFEAFPGKIYKGSVVYNNPAFEVNNKINLLRIRVNNTGQQLKPGMLAYVNVLATSTPGLVIPKSALIIESMTKVWVQRAEGVFERRMVSTGAKNKHEVQILSGIKAGEKVVTSGSYLLNSEYILIKGAGSMAGMKM